MFFLEIRQFFFVCVNRGWITSPLFAEGVFSFNQRRTAVYHEHIQQE